MAGPSFGFGVLFPDPRRHSESPLSAMPFGLPRAEAAWATGHGGEDIGAVLRFTPAEPARDRAERPVGASSFLQLESLFRDSETKRSRPGPPRDETCPDLLAEVTALSKFLADTRLE